MAAGGESIARLYTRSGDSGTTALSGGSRVAKDSPRVRAYGAYDELGAYLGLAYLELPDQLGEIRTIVRRLENELFIVSAELADPTSSRRTTPRIEARHVERLESDIGRFEETFRTLRLFVLPGGSRPAALLHVARTVARRAEREVWTLNRVEPQRPELLSWANRVSGLLFALALETNRLLGVGETSPDYSL